VIIDKRSASSKEKGKKDLSKVDYREIKYPDFGCANVDLS
jgi:hypothetical protein